MSTRLQIPQPGIAWSREKAYHVRDALVRHAMPQKSWPIVAISTTALAAAGVSPVLKIASEEPSPKPLAATLSASLLCRPRT